MKHLGEATILAARDGGPVGDDARAHLQSCATCRARLTAAESRAEAIDRTLSALDRPIEPTAAKAGVRARLRPAGDVGAHGRRSRWSGGHLGRAAALLLLTAGAAAALPGSPLRSLLSPIDDPSVPAPTVDDAVPGSVDAVGATFSDDQDAVGIAVAVPDGSVHVVVRGARAGTDLSVVWTSQSSARVVAPAGSRFTYAAGRIEVDASRGAIRIELPRDAGDVSLEVDGRIYLHGSPETLRIDGPMVERTSASIRFQVDEG